MQYKVKEDNLAKSETSTDINASVAWNIFWVGFILYTISFSFPGINISLKYSQPFQIAGMIILVPSGFYLIRWNFENAYLKVLFLIYTIWSFFVIIRGFSLDYNILKTLIFFAPFSIFLYFVPFVVIFRDGFANLRKLFNVIIILSLAFLVYVITYYRLLFFGDSGFFRVPTVVTETFVHFLSFPVSFILLTYLYHKKKTILFAVFIIVLTFLLVTVRARRGLMFMTLCFMVFSYVIYYFTNRGKILKVILSIVLLVLLVFYAFLTYSKNQSGMFGLITNRIDEDTRNGVEDYFYSNMSVTNLAFGKGINGSYYCPGIDETQGSVTMFRTAIETGYLQIVLKGGFMSLILYLLITIPAIFAGLFSSKNVLSKASAVWIFLYTIFLYPTYVNMFSMTYIIIWISVGICYSKSMREKSDEEIMKVLNFKDQ